MYASKNQRHGHASSDPVVGWTVGLWWAARLLQNGENHLSFVGSRLLDAEMRTRQTIASRANVPDPCKRKKMQGGEIYRERVRG